jgi:hypothetical protein
MVWKEEQINKLYELKEAGATWHQISISLGKNIEAIRKFYTRHKALASLPAKITMRKRVTDGQVGSSIKRIVQVTPTVKISDIPALLREAGTSPARVPSRRTVSNFLAESGFVVKRAVKALDSGQESTEKGPVCGEVVGER